MSTLFTWNLFVGGNGNDFTRTLGSSGITPFSGICSHASIPKEVFSILYGCRNCPAEKIDPYQLQHFTIKYLREALFWQFTKALFPEVEVSCKDTAPSVYISRYLSGFMITFQSAF